MADWSAIYLREELGTGPGFFYLWDKAEPT